MECLWWTPGGSGEEKATNMKSNGTYVVGRDERLKGVLEVHRLIS